MNLTRSVSYAVGILLQIARGSRGEPMTASKIAQGCKFPPRFLYRVLRRLVDAGLLVGTSGPGGGYALARPASKITLLDIVTAVDAEPEPTVLPAVRPKYRRSMAAINRVCKQSADQFNKNLKKLTLTRLTRMK